MVTAAANSIVMTVNLVGGVSVTPRIINVTFWAATSI